MSQNMHNRTAKFYWLWSKLESLCDNASYTYFLFYVKYVIIPYAYFVRRINVRSNLARVSANAQRITESLKKMVRIGWKFRRWLNFGVSICRTFHDWRSEWLLRVVSFGVAFLVFDPAAFARFTVVLINQLAIIVRIIVCEIRWD